MREGSRVRASIAGRSVDEIRMRIGMCCYNNNNKPFSTARRHPLACFHLYVVRPTNTATTHLLRPARSFHAQRQYQTNVRLLNFTSAVHVSPSLITRYVTRAPRLVDAGSHAHISHRAAR